MKKLIGRYPTRFGYTLVIKTETKGIEKIIFATETEADEYIKEEKL